MKTASSEILNVRKERVVQEEGGWLGTRKNKDHHCCDSRNAGIVSGNYHGLRVLTSFFIASQDEGGERSMQI